jgi:hypothetical protein
MKTKAKKTPTPKLRRTVLVTTPETEAIIAEAMRRTKQTKSVAGNDLLRLAASIRRFPVLDSIPKGKEN